MISIFLYNLGQFLTLHLPIGVSYGIARTVAGIKWHFARRDQETVRDNLRRIFTEKSEQEIYALASAVYVNFAKYLTDFLRFSKVDSEFRKENVAIEGLDNLNRALESGKGVILLSAHIGNWELGAAIVAQLGYKMNAIALDHKNGKVNDFFVNKRERMGVHVISVGLSIKKCFRILKGDNILAVVGDKLYNTTGIEVDFFSRRALFPRGAGVFSYKSGSPIVVCAMFREKGDTFRLVFEEPIYPDRSADIDEEVKRLISEYASHLEGYVLKYPDQWYKFDKVWKD